MGENAPGASMHRPLLLPNIFRLNYKMVYFLGGPDDRQQKPFLSRYKQWYTLDFVRHHGPPKCHGKVVRQICIFGIGDLKFLKKRRELFANKFHLDFHHFALDCMEELLFKKTLGYYLGKLSFNSSYYGTIPQVRYKVS